MPPKKAPKKAAKKSPKHHDKNHEGKDLRRAYEHLGRLQAIESLVPATVSAQIGAMTKLAQSSINAGEQKSAADLLRAGEHLAFGSLASASKATKLGEELEAAINAEYEHLMDKAAEHWERHGDERPDGVEELYDTMLEAASDAYGKSAYRRALEFARGAEALAHVHKGEPMRLEDGGATKRKKLKS